MKWFKSKKQNDSVKDDVLFSKTLDYNGFSISVWVKKDETNYGSIVIGEYEFGLRFATGWTVSNGLNKYGIYNTGITSDGLQRNLNDHVLNAKKYIDARIKEPDNIQEAMNIVNNLT